MKRLFVVPLVLFIVVLSAGASQAHTKVPTSVTCNADSCNGIQVHQTDGGSNCINSITDKQSIPIKDRDGRTEVTVHIFASNTCNTYWGTVYTDTTYASYIFVNTERQAYPGDSDDPYTNTVQPNGYTWPNYCHQCWLDQGMAGFDSSGEPNGLDCFDTYYDVTDRYNVTHSGTSSTFCSG
jgi:hypothetical protein